MKILTISGSYRLGSSNAKLLNQLHSLSSNLEFHYSSLPKEFAVVYIGDCRGQYFSNSPCMAERIDRGRWTYYLYSRIYL